MWVFVRSISGFSAGDAANFFKFHGMLTSDEVLDQVRFSLSLIELNPMAQLVFGTTTQSLSDHTATHGQYWAVSRSRMSYVGREIVKEQGLRAQMDSKE
jgi:hypothetical protein